MFVLSTMGEGSASVSSKIVTQMAANALEQGEIGEQLGDLQLPGPCYWIASRSEKIVALKAQLRIPTLAVDKLCNPDSQYSSTKHPRPSCLCQRNRQTDNLAPLHPVISAPSPCYNHMASLLFSESTKHILFPGSLHFLSPVPGGLSPELPHL